ncbi:hypothetical protein B0H67DRAFT_345604 [Lasiosphaeris hirsuta]|uniref:Uncharacterized protein n=1 Tax=Lasiosphaeris hirsuta TaxID=260670 RepID=A0AA40A3J6_9PEZI|nr:hypothetical protein B0H67DRAFT_345604 [Lasiosphaeris hirsuta]
MSTGIGKSKTEERKIYTNRHGEEVSVNPCLGFIFPGYFSPGLTAPTYFISQTIPTTRVQIHPCW